MENALHTFNGNWREADTPKSACSADILEVLKNPLAGDWGFSKNGGKHTVNYARPNSSSECHTDPRKEGNKGLSDRSKADSH